MRALRIALAAGALLVIGSCTPKGPPTCADAGDCVSIAGELLGCQDNLCVEVECLKSSDCGLFEYCSENDRCIPGCETDDDCLAGESCDTTNHACMAYGCRTTELDCGIGEICDQGTGECRADPAPHCMPCDPYDWWGTPCPDGGTCFSWEGRPEDEGFCLVTCNTAIPDQCPRGYACMDVNGYGAFCIASCPTLSDMGLLPY